MGKIFTVEELCLSTTAQRLHLDNTPNAQQRAALVELIENVLNPARERFGRPIWVTSGFRCPQLNGYVGGKSTSQHLRGEAADLDSHYNRELFELIRDHLEFDQLINEQNFRWIHVSFRKGNNRRQVLAL